MRTQIVGAAMLAVLSLTAACGGDAASTGDVPSTAATSGSSTQQAEHNKADVRFAQSMIPHHEQAVAMSELALRRSDDGELRELAKQIKAAQAPEIRKLKEFLNAWDAPAQPDTNGHGSMTGMMSGAQMRQLKQAQGAEFDAMWIQMMIEHHRGAVEMAGTELKQGANAEAKQLAREIVEAQEAEIERMKAMAAK